MMKNPEAAEPLDPLEVIVNATEPVWEHFWYDTSDGGFHWLQIWSPYGATTPPALIHAREEGQDHRIVLSNSQYQYLCGMASAIETHNREAYQELSAALTEILEAGQES
jgi:hypothetical protein